MNLSSLPSFFSFLASTFLGVYVFSKNPRKIHNVAFGIALFSFAVMEFGNFMFLRSLEENIEILWIKTSMVGAALIPPAWSFFSIIFARKNAEGVIKKWKNYLILISFVSFIFIFLLLSSDSIVKGIFRGIGDGGIFLGAGGYYFNIFLLLSIIIIVVNFENTFRQTKGIEKWQIKYAVIGIIGGFCFFIYNISETLLYSFMRIKLIVGGSFIILMVNLLLAFSLVRHRLLDVNVFVSRQIIYRSISILIIGIYLFFTGILIELTRFVGEENRLLLRPIIIFIVMAFLGVLLLSDRTRRKIQVFINRNFFANKYDYRYVWTEFTLTESLSIKNKMIEIYQKCYPKCLK